MNQEDEIWMRRALSLAEQGRGRVEPNPMVGCVLVRDGHPIGEGFHRHFGQDHAEVEAINDAKLKGHDPAGATAFVTLEPCSHYGKTPPCSLALIQARVKRVVIATCDPSPHVAGSGIAQLRAAGIDVQVGVLEADARQILAPFLKRVHTGLPWVIAKWAMSLDGKLATRSGHSQWISGPPARQVVHQLRGNVDAIMVGIGTAIADDPALTARGDEAQPHRPPNRLATRVVVDRTLRLGLDSQLVKTANTVPVLIACDAERDKGKRQQLRDAGAEVWSPQNGTRQVKSLEHGPEDFDYAGLVRQLLRELAGRGMTNVLVEGGAALLGNLFDQNLIDEVYVFVSPKLIGGAGGVSPIAGLGREQVPQTKSLQRVSHQVVGDDVLIHGYTNS